VPSWRKVRVDWVRDNAWSRLGESNPRPTHYERGPEDEVADGWCLRALGYSFQSVAGDGDDGRSGAKWGTGGRTSDVNDADVVCIRAIESEKASP
jgi:hypothetical protein